MAGAEEEMNHECYCWYRENYRPTPWKICQISNGFVHFFGQVSQEVGNEYLTKYVEFGDQIPPPPAANIAAELVSGKSAGG